MQAQNLIVQNKNVKNSIDINNKNAHGKFRDSTLNNQFKHDFNSTFAKASIIEKQSHPNTSMSLDATATETRTNQLDSDSSVEVSELKLVATDLPYLPDNEITPIISKTIMDDDNIKLKIINLSSVCNPTDLNDNLILSEQDKRFFSLTKENEDIFYEIIGSDAIGNLFVQFHKIDKMSIDETKNDSVSIVIKIAHKELADLDVSNIVVKNQVENAISKTRHIIFDSKPGEIENSLGVSIEIEDENQQVLASVLKKQLIPSNVDENNDNLCGLVKKMTLLSKEHIASSEVKKDISLDDNKIVIKNGNSDGRKNENPNSEVVNNAITSLKDNRIDLKLLNILEVQEVAVNRFLRQYISDQKEPVLNTKNATDSELTGFNLLPGYKSFDNLSHNKNFNFDLLIKTSVNVDVGNNNDFHFFNSLISDKSSSSGVSTTQSELFPRTLTNEVLSQIVSKTVTGFNNGHSTIKINLIPEHLGRLNLTISTDNNHVVIKIFTESPLVKEIIENNISQLKAALGSQGMEIDRFDVLVSSDSGPDAHRYGGKKNFKMTDEDDDLLKDEGLDKKRETPSHVYAGKGVNLIGVFA